MRLDEFLGSVWEFKDTPTFKIVKGKHTLDLNAMDILNVSCDSRHVQKGYIFGVLTAHPETAIKYIDEAAAKGVNLIVVSFEIFTKLHTKSYFNTVIWFVCERPRQLFSNLASKFYGAQPENCVAVTGTAGKTSVCAFVLQLWSHLKIPSASIGTLGLQHSMEGLNIDYTSTLTTPDPIQLHKCLAELKHNGTDRVVMEASSHGLHQHRLDGLRFKVVAFTSFSQDHLDYHLTMKQYFRAKLRLFEELVAKDGWAVLNADIPEYPTLVKTCVLGNYPFYSYGKEGNFIRMKNILLLHHGVQHLTLEINAQEYSIHFPLMGSRQIDNLMCAMAIVISMGGSIPAVIQAVQKITPVPGRLSLAGQHPNGAMTYVDYAHKPEALECVLKDMRVYCKGNLHLVFGCGGDRDKDKRSIMGNIAQQYADHVIVTDDNPRMEDAATIRQHVLAGCPDAMEIGDRKKAIRYAIDNLQPNDILIVAGKGHEKYQIMGTEKIPFDDIEVIQSFIPHLNP